MATGGTKPVGEFEVIYVPTQGLDYSRPYNTLDKEFLAPDTINTESINGFLCSSPWVAESPWSTELDVDELVIGQYVINTGQADGVSQSNARVIVVTNLAVYLGNQATTDIGVPKSKGTLDLVHAWDPVTEFNTTFLAPGNVCSFVEMQTGPLNAGTVAVVYFTGMMLKGVFQFHFVGGLPALDTASTYVCGRYLTELGGRLVIGEAMFPTLGGPFGYVASPTIAWSGVGLFAGAGVNDPWDPANFATLNGNIGGFNLLEDVSDQITGIATIGRSAYIARENGITQMDPGPSGIDPFLFYHLWASPQGVGALVNTFQQYGQTIIFLSSDNVYALTLQGGIQPLGDKIIAKVNADARSKGFEGAFGLNWNETGAATNWYFASIVTIAGQLHYVLNFNAYSGTLIAAGGAEFTPTCLVYDLNLSDGGWHIWDLGQYYQQDGAQTAGFFVLTCPILDCHETYVYQYQSVQAVAVSNPHFLFGGIILFQGSTGAANPAGGSIFQFVPFDYDVSTNPYIAYWNALYTPLALPATTIKFRGEQVQLGHTINMRRLRMQSQNAPLPATVANYQGQATVRFEGSINGSVSSNPINIAVPVLMETDYGDVVLGDEMIQASIVAVVTGGTPWLNLPLLRLSTVSIIGSDTKGSTA